MTSYVTYDSVLLVACLQLNRAEFDDMDPTLRTQYEGFRPGLYVRIQINGMPCEFVQHLDATYPILLGGLLSAEQNIGYVQVSTW